jgi:hypothetical protein
MEIINRRASEFVNELRSIRERLEELKERQPVLEQPVLNDYALLPMLYEWFGEILSEMGLRPDRTMRRKHFIFIAIALYSPATFCGRKTKRGLCQELSRIFNVNKANISRRISNMLFLFENYKDYGTEAGAIYEQIISRLTIEFPNGKILKIQ